MRTLISAVAVAFACTFTLSACSESEPTTTTKSTPKADPAVSSDDLSGSGTEADPYSLGNTLVTDKADIVVNSFTADGTKEVLKFNAEGGMDISDLDADDGNSYALVNITVNYKGQGSSNVFDYRFAYLSADGEEHGVENEKMLAIPDPAELDGLNSGDSTTGNVIVEIPADQKGILRVKVGPFDEGYFRTE